MPFEAGAGAQHRSVLDRGGDEVPSLGAGCPGQARDGEVRVLGRAAGEDDLAGLGAQRGRYFLAGVIEPLAGPPAGGVEARGVAEMRR